MGEGNKKLSKRNPESNLFLHKDRGFIPEGLLNYLSLLGWSIAPDRDIFTLDELCANFDVANVNPNPARFDQKKADSINATHIRLLEPADFEARIQPYLQSAGVLPASPSPEQLELLHKLSPLVQERITVLSEAAGMLGFMFQSDDQLHYEADALEQLPENAKLIIETAVSALRDLTDFTTDAIQAKLSEALVDGLGEKPRNAFGPIRTAFSGRRVTPPLFECMEFLGRERSISRLEAFASAH